MRAFHVFAGSRMIKVVNCKTALGTTAPPLLLLSLYWHAALVTTESAEVKSCWQTGSEEPAVQNVASSTTRLVAHMFGRSSNRVLGQSVVARFAFLDRLKPSPLPRPTIRARSIVSVAFMELNMAKSYIGCLLKLLSEISTNQLKTARCERFMRTFCDNDPGSTPMRVHTCVARRYLFNCFSLRWKLAISIFSSSDLLQESRGCAAVPSRHITVSEFIGKVSNE